jgi:hypothetical protein
VGEAVEAVVAAIVDLTGRALPGVGACQAPVLDPPPATAEARRAEARRLHPAASGGRASVIVVDFAAPAETDADGGGLAEVYRLADRRSAALRRERDAARGRPGCWKGRGW